MSASTYQNMDDSKLWQTASKVSDKSYELLSSLPEEEKWGLQSKIRARSFDVSSDVAEAIGSIDPRDTKWHLGMARRSLFGLKNALILASKAGYVDTDPELMHQINEITEMIEQEINNATDSIAVWFKEMNQPDGDKK